MDCRCAAGLAPVRASSSGSAPESLEPDVAGSFAVYKAALLACCGAFLFGYHLGVLNGPLQQIAQDLAFGENVAMQGLVRTLPQQIHPH